MSTAFCHVNSVQADPDNQLIRHIVVSTRTVTTLAGLSGGTGGYANGVGTAVLFSYPQGVALDAAGTVGIVVSIRRNMCFEWKKVGCRDRFAHVERVEWYDTRSIHYLNTDPDTVCHATV